MTRAPRAHEVLPSSTPLDPLSKKESQSNLVALRASKPPLQPCRKATISVLTEHSPGGHVST